MSKLNRQDLLEELENAYEEIYKIIMGCHERGQFNSNYFEPKFKRWFAKKLDKKEMK